MHPNPTRSYPAADLVNFARELFHAAGCETEKAEVLAEILVEADLLGHTTHGLALAADYLLELESGGLCAAGQPKIIVERPALAVWDGERLPGPWLVVKALELACQRVRQSGVFCVAIRRSHHIACLEAYLGRATGQGLMALIACSDPSAASVAPFGGRSAVFTPNPLAVGIPTSGEPIWIDMSASITTNALSARLARAGDHFPGQWALDAAGNPTNDPAVVFSDPPGTLLPTGGCDHGHKGYALAWLVEALSQGLSGYGRRQKPTTWGASVYIQVIDPELFAGLEELTAEMDWTAAACLSSPPVDARKPVRLPGQAAWHRRLQGLANGVILHPGVLESLAPWASRFGLRLPGQ